VGDSGSFSYREAGDFAPCCQIGSGRCTRRDDAILARSERGYEVQLVDMRCQLLGPELDRVLCCTTRGVEDPTGHGAELAVVGVLVKLDEYVVSGRIGLRHKDEYVQSRG
jgi:hypothetical protein